jgi:hypothetical protein
MNSRLLILAFAALLASASFVSAGKSSSRRALANDP